jgi:hypothetical protein
MVVPAGRATAPSAAHQCSRFAADRRPAESASRGRMWCGRAAPRSPRRGRHTPGCTTCDSAASVSPGLALCARSERPTRRLCRSDETRVPDDRDPLEASVRRRWSESSKRSSASVGAGVPFRGFATARPPTAAARKATVRFHPPSHESDRLLTGRDTSALEWVASRKSGSRPVYRQLGLGAPGPLRRLAGCATAAFGGDPGRSRYRFTSRAEGC